MNDERIAYFSMEIGLENRMPTYSGGLGILAGDTVRAAADLGLPLVAVTLLYRKGYFRQRLEADGWQREEPVEWAPHELLEEMPQRVSLALRGRTVWLRSWKAEVRGVGSGRIAVYFLDSDLDENAPEDRSLTDSLYGGDATYRLCQEAILGIGGVRMLRELGYASIRRFHMNEGHASLLTLELLDEAARSAGRETVAAEDLGTVREQCVFTTHTPVPAGHDQFPLDLVRYVIGPREDFLQLKDVMGDGGVLNMTLLALNASHYVNGVAKRHGEVSRMMFAGYAIDAITNGVHAATWVAEPFAALYDRVVPGWREDNSSLRYAVSIPRPEVWEAHVAAKRRLIERVSESSGVTMDPGTFTIGFARRASTYKRGALLFDDIERLKAAASQRGAIQIVYAGKAHPHDVPGKEVIKQIFRAKDALEGTIQVAYLEDYDMDDGRIITSGVDLWLNTPEPPQEASGTSGMKAALNGIPSLSVLDGWWIEGHIEGLTGWAIGDAGRACDGSDRSRDAQCLYEKLETTILPLYYGDRERFIDVMRFAMALNGSFFNTQRMMREYVQKAYF
ncbi:MAG: alpha-glucan family phosphorylase [Candidatus Bipolaricaulota bacterium]